MSKAKSARFTAGLSRAVALTLVLAGFAASPGLAQDELRPELVPGLDLWTQQREVPAYWRSETTTPDVLPRAKRHQEFLQAGVPLEYRNRTNPYPAATQIIEDGGELYEAHCASCHGALGLGDGEAGRDLTPSPALLAYLIERPRAVDEYLLWTVSEGGAQFGTEMPAFKDVLTEQQIWQIVIYMRAGIPHIAKSSPD